jgi:hypothetical protein
VGIGGIGPVKDVLAKESKGSLYLTQFTHYTRSNLMAHSLNRTVACEPILLSKCGGNLRDNEDREQQRRQTHRRRHSMLGLERIGRPLRLSAYGDRQSRSERLHSLRRPLRLEELESRTLLAYAPAQIIHAYGFDRLPYDGSGQTIAIVDAFDNSSLTYDLQNFDQLFNLPDPVLTIAQPQGQPTYDQGWGLETDLDVEWAHAIAPAANILLVEAKNDDGNNLLAAVNYARQQTGVVVVSISWAASEFAAEKLYDSDFTTPPGHIGGSGLPGGITFVAASGDNGGIVAWPASSPNVLSIGGTTLTLDDNNQTTSEIGWSGSGGGLSSYEPAPNYQLPFQTTGMRTTPDFAYNADLATPFWTYASNYGGLQAVYGTSAGAPQWAALIALADQALASNGIGSLDGLSQTIPDLYNLATVSYSTYYNDIVDGNNGYQAGPGYDLVTGIGTPIADQIVEALVNGAQPPGGNAAAPGTWLASSVARAEAIQGSLPPASASHLVLVSTPMAGVSATLARQNALQLSDFVRQTLFSTVPSKPSPEVSQASLVTNLAVPLVQSAPRDPGGSPGIRLESGGGSNAVLTDEPVDGNDADTVTPPVSKAAPAAAFFAVTAMPASGSDAAKSACSSPDVGLGRSGLALLSNAGEPAHAAALNPLVELPDPVVAVGTVAIALGGYWGTPLVIGNPSPAFRLRRNPMR